MAQLNVKLPDSTLAALKRLAEGRRTPVAWLIKDYVSYLLSGGEPVMPPRKDDLLGEMASLADSAQAFGWLREEPEVYNATDGEPV